MITEMVPGTRELTGDRELEELYLPPGPRHLRLNFVTSLDGVVEMDGRSAPLGGPADRAAFMAMRAVSDVVLAGAGTVRAENYGPVRLPDDVRARRRARGQAELPRLAVVTRSGDLDPGARVFSGSEPVLVLTTEELAGRRPDLAGAAELVTCGQGEVDVAIAVGELQRRGLGRILCEGGPALARSLLDAGVVDELCLTISPTLAGAGRRLIGSERVDRPRRLQLTGLLESDGLLLARYRVAAP